MYCYICTSNIALILNGMTYARVVVSECFETNVVFGRKGGQDCRM